MRSSPLTSPRTERSTTSGAIPESLSIEAGTRNAIGLDEYVVIHGRARITEGGAPELLQRLAHTYLGPDVKFPTMDHPPPGFITHIAVQRIGGVGPWAS
jgi:hypothetical protein